MDEILTAQEQELIKSVLQLGDEILGWRNDSRARNVLSKQNLKLQADRWAHERFKKILSQLWPDVPVVSEEDVTHNESRPAKYWLIDPIDGTASWLHGFDGFVTQAALIDNEVPIAGYIYAPARRKFYVGLRGRGAFLNGVRLHRAANQSLTEPVIVDNTPEPHGVVKHLMAKILMRYRESGSLGLKSCMVASGEADLFVKDVVVRDWDLAPAAVVLHEMGAVLVQANGQPYQFCGPWEKASGFIVARTPALAQTVSAELACIAGTEN